MSPVARSTAPRFRTDATRWRAVQQRDAAADGAFVFAVTTTGVFCRPSCSARRAKREHVRFFTTSDEARQAGFRACKRCRPTGVSQAHRHGEAVANACRLIETAAEVPSLATLAEAVGLSPFHFHRIFKEATGVTPKAYADAHRARRVRDELPAAGSVTEAIYGAGFNSNGRFYATAAERLGMTPTAYRNRGAGTTIRFAVAECSLGHVLVATTDRGVCAIFLGDDPDTLTRELQDRFRHARLIGGDADFEQWISRVVALVEQPTKAVELPVDLRGTAFQVRVWEALRRIPSGTTTNYAALAAQLGQPTAARAVAQACAANPIAIAVPCHRVVRTDESLSGYRWGVERKAELLRRERASR